MTIEEITQKLCRTYPIPCPACGTENSFLRLRPDIFRVTNSERDGHPIKIGWREEGEFPEWVTPINHFWGVCARCRFTAQLDETEFRTWKKSAKKYLALFSEGALEAVANQANVDQGTLQVLSKGIQPTDLFGTLLAQFYLGIFTECLKASPFPNTLARCYQRIAWIYRDRERLYEPFVENSNIQTVLEEAAPVWRDELLPNSDFPVLPEVVTDEVAALRFALAYYEWNFIALQSSKHEDAMRLMMLIAETGYRIYELTDDTDDFKKAQTLFSGAMQKSMAVVNDKRIIGGAVNVAKDTLDKAGDRGRDLRTLRQRREKARKKSAATAPKPDGAPSKPPVKTKASPSREPEPVPAQTPEPAQPASPSPISAMPLEPAGTPPNVLELHKKIAQLDEENKRWMRLAGISQLTGLPNHVMLSRVLLPGAVKQATSRRESLGCIMISPEGLPEINAKHGRDTGDFLIKKFCECLKVLVRKGERLSHTESVNFALIVPALQSHQLRKRAEALHKDLTSRRFDLSGATFSLRVSMGISRQEVAKGTAAKDLKDLLYIQALEALDRAKLQGNQIEVFDTPSPKR